MTWLGPIRLGCAGHRWGVWLGEKKEEGSGVGVCGEKERWARPKVRKGPCLKENKEMGQKMRPIPI